MTGWRKLYLAGEFAVLFLALPMLSVRVLPRRMGIPVLILLSILCLGLLMRDRSFDRKRLWNAKAIVGEWRRILSIFLGVAAVMTLVVLIFDRGSLFGFVRVRPDIWAMVMVFYPVFSVYPQGIIYRAFLFHRYQPLLPSVEGRIVVSALAFGLVHIFFKHPIPVVMTIFGGVLFAVTYKRTASLAAAWMEHAMYGAFVFTIGIGRFFFHGSVQTVAWAKHILAE